MDLLQLRYFQVVARTEHMSKAAEELYIAQPSLSKTILRLEKELGVPLFDRQGRSIRLNQFGKEFLEHVKQIFHELEEGKRKVRDMAGLEQGSISLIAASLSFFPDLLHSFQIAHPAVHFKLSQCMVSEMLPRLENGSCDFCFSSSPLLKHVIQWQPLHIGEILLVVPNGHRLAGRDTVPLRELADEGVVIEKVGHGLRDLIDGFFQQAGITPHIICEVDEPATILGFVKAGLGVAFAPELVKRQINERALTTVHLSHPTCQTTFGLAWHKEHFLSQAACTFREFVVEYCARLKLLA